RVPAGASRSAGQSGPLPSHSSSGSHAPAEARHSRPRGWKPSTGQSPLAPLQVSVTSQDATAGRQIACSVLNSQSVVQHEDAEPLAPARSHCSPPSTTPSPHTAKAVWAPAARTRKPARIRTRDDVVILISCRLAKGRRVGDDGYYIGSASSQ